MAIIRNELANGIRAELALMPDGSDQWVIVAADGRLHAASSWLRYLTDIHRSPHTVEHYGRRVAAYLDWTARTTDWRLATLTHLRLWMRTLGQSPTRSARTVVKYLVALRSFYSWAEANDLVVTGLSRRMTESKYFRSGTPAGGEHGAYRQVLVPELRPVDEPVDETPEWIEDPAARARLVALDLNRRDRFIIDLLYYLGIRAGEALSLFKEDLHFGGGSAALKCKFLEPHLHVRMGNPTENGARSKGKARMLFVTPNLIDRYVDYVIEKDLILGINDDSRHVLVNLYTHDRFLGRAMTESGLQSLVDRVSRRIHYPITGPHVLRHTFATRLARGIDCDPQDLDVIQKLLGHRNIRSTRRYTHGLEPAMKAALASLEPRTLDILRTFE